MDELMGKYGFVKIDSNDYVRAQGEYVIKARVLDFIPGGFNPRMYTWVIHKKNGLVNDNCISATERVTASNKIKVATDILNRMNTYVNMFI
jgi:hypothetical protein